MMIEGFTGSVRNIVHFRPTGFDIEVFRARIGVWNLFPSGSAVLDSAG